MQALPDAKTSTNLGTAKQENTYLEQDLIRRRNPLKLHCKPPVPENPSVRKLLPSTPHYLPTLASAPEKNYISPNLQPDLHPLSGEITGSNLGRARKKTQASPNHQPGLPTPPGEINPPDEPNHLIGGSLQPSKPGTAPNQQPPGKTQLYIYTLMNPGVTSLGIRQSFNILPLCRNILKITSINNTLTQLYKNIHINTYKHDSLTKYTFFQVPPDAETSTNLGNTYLEQASPSPSAPEKNKISPNPQPDLHPLSDETTGPETQNHTIERIMLGQPYNQLSLGKTQPCINISPTYGKTFPEPCQSYTSVLPCKKTHKTPTK